MSSLNDCIKFSLDIEDPNIVFKDYFYDNGAKVYKGELIQPACPLCGSVKLLHNGHYISNIHYISANASKPVIIRLAKQRVICHECRKNSMATTSLIDKYCHISNITKQKVLTGLTEDRSMVSIGCDTNVSANTVQRVLNDYDEFFRFNFNYLPEHLAFDEFRGVNRQLHFIYLQNKAPYQIQQILPDRSKSSIRKYFERFPLLTRQRVTTVTLDLNSYYQSLVKELFPNAKVIIDRFHLVQMMNRSFNQLRVRVMKQFNPRSMKYRLLKSPWKLYLMHYEDLEKTKIFYNRHLRDRKTEEHIVLNGIQTNSLLSHSYWELQSFTKALRHNDRQEMEAIIKSDELVGPEMEINRRTFQRNLSSIINACDYPQYSNGPLEGIIHKIKQIQRTAYGFRNFHNLLVRIKLQQTSRNQKRSKHNCLNL